ncbi:M23 family metallopeptidase [Geodermatophilus sp. SYSU D01105]
MTPQTGPALLERPRTDREPGPVVPAPRSSPEFVAATPAPAPATDDVPETPPRRRTVPRPPGRRGPLWLAALVAGAVVAALPSALGSDATDISVSAAEYGLGTASDVGLISDMEDAGVRRGITEAEAQARLGELAASRAAREPKTVLPTPGRMSTCFCMRWGSMHWGIDLAAPLGTPIVAAVDGVVIRAGAASGYGNAIYIQDADGNVHIYGHMRYYSVKAGDIVHAGDPIAKVGSEGQSTGPHLHYEIHRGGMTGRPIDPEQYLADRGVGI